MDATLESRSLLLDVRQQSRQQAVGLQNVIIYDDDHYYMGGVLAELLATNGYKVSLVTPAPMISYWSQFTLEQERIQAKLMKLGVKLFPQNMLSEIGKDFVRLSNTISGDEIELPRDGVVLVTDRTPNDELYQALCASSTFHSAKRDGTLYELSAMPKRRILLHKRCSQVISRRGSLMRRS